MTDDFDERIAVVSDEDARTILDNQVNTIQHIQSQGLGTLRVVFAVVAIVVTILVAGVGPIESPYESNYTSSQAMDAANSTALSDEAVAGFVLGGTFMIPFILLIGAAILVHGVLQIIKLLKPMSLQPNLGFSHVSVSPQSADLLYDSKKEQKTTNSRDWIWHNSQEIEEGQKRLSTGITDIYVCVFLFAIAVSVYTSAYSVHLLMLIAIHIAILIFSLLMILIVGRMLINARQEQGNTLSESCQIAKDEFKQLIFPSLYIGWGTNTRIVVAASYGFIFFVSIIVLLVSAGLIR